LTPIGDFRSFTLSVHGFRGGHTGVDIHRGRANAIQLLPTLLSHNFPLSFRFDSSSSSSTCSNSSSDSSASSTTSPVTPIPDFYLLQLSGGNAPNAIPRSSELQLLVHKDHAKQLENHINERWEQVQKLYWDVEIIEEKTNENSEKKGKPLMKMELTVTELDEKNNTFLPYTKESSKAIIDHMGKVPHGVLRMNPDIQGEVLSSISFSLASLKLNSLVEQKNTDEKVLHSTDVFHMHLFARAPDDNQLRETSDLLDKTCHSMGASNLKWFNSFAGWAPDIKSPLLKTTLEAHQQLYSKSPRVYSVHAGLECGLLKGRYPNLDCVSIGPTIKNAHSPDEQLELATVGPFYDWLKRILILLSQQKS